MDAATAVEGWGLDLTVDAHLLWLWVPLWLESQSHGHYLLLMGSLGALWLAACGPVGKRYAGIAGTISPVSQFCLLYGFSTPSFRWKDVWNSLTSWCVWQRHLVELWVFLLVITWRGGIQGASHSAMMLMWFSFLNSYYQFSFHHIHRFSLHNIHQRVFPR